MKHEEATLHLQFCKWVKKHYPDFKFVRHEKEKARSVFLQGLMKVYNSIGGLPDWEGIMPYGGCNGLYIEFKKPGEQWQVKGIVKAVYQHQYEFHLHAWSIGRCAYFCNDLMTAQDIITFYINGTPLPQQRYELRDLTNNAKADEFFSGFGL